MARGISLIPELTEIVVRGEVNNHFYNQHVDLSLVPSDGLLPGTIQYEVPEITQNYNQHIGRNVTVQSSEIPQVGINYPDDRKVTIYGRTIPSDGYGIKLYNRDAYEYDKTMAHIRKMSRDASRANGFLMRHDLAPSAASGKVMVTTGVSRSVTRASQLRSDTGNVNVHKVTLSDLTNLRTMIERDLEYDAAINNIYVSVPSVMWDDIEEIYRDSGYQQVNQQLLTTGFIRIMNGMTFIRMNEVIGYVTTGEGSSTTINSKVNIATRYTAVGIPDDTTTQRHVSAMWAFVPLSEFMVASAIEQEILDDQGRTPTTQSFNASLYTRWIAGLTRTDKIGSYALAYARHA